MDQRVEIDGGFIKGTSCFRHIIIVLICLLSASMCPALSAKEAKGVFAKIVPSETRIFAGQRFVVDVVLFVPADLDVASINRISAPDFGGMKWSETSINRNDRTVLEGEKSKDGRYLMSTVGRYVVLASAPGRYDVNPGRYYADVLTGERIVDPFWGTAYSQKKRIEVRSESSEIKVTELPKGGSAERMGVGDFEATWILPPGDIEPDQEGIVILEMQGYGDLQKANWPALGKAFGEGLKFIGMTPQVNVFIKNGRIYSIARLECAFSSPEPGTFTLDSAEVPFVSAARRKIASAKTKPIRIKIEKRKRPNRPAQYLEI